MEEMTVVTPTYNRKHTLPRVYESLLKQTSKSFVWMVVDDGSTDGTEELIRGYQQEDQITIEYIKKENGGKASALNVSLDYVKTPYCVCLDSDDTFSDTAIEMALKFLNEEDNNEECCGLIGLRHNPDGTIMGGKEIPHQYKYITIMDIYYNCNIRSEFIAFYKTKILNQYRFPSVPGEKFISPAWFHYTLSEKYKFRSVRDVYCYCEYICDGLTRNKRKVIVNNPVGYTLVKRFSLKYSIGFKEKVKNAIMYDCGCILSGDKHWLSNAPRKLVAVFCYPLGYGVYLKRFRKIKKDYRAGKYK